MGDNREVRGVQLFNRLFEKVFDFKTKPDMFFALLAVEKGEPSIKTSSISAIYKYFSEDEKLRIPIPKRFLSYLLQNEYTIRISLSRRFHSIDYREVISCCEELKLYELKDHLLQAQDDTEFFFAISYFIFSGCLNNGIVLIEEIPDMIREISFQDVQEYIAFSQEYGINSNIGARMLSILPQTRYALNPYLLYDRGCAHYFRGSKEDKKLSIADFWASYIYGRYETLWDIAYFYLYYGCDYTRERTLSAEERKAESYFDTMSITINYMKILTRRDFKIAFCSVGNYIGNIIDVVENRNKTMKEAQMDDVLFDSMKKVLNVICDDILKVSDVSITLGELQEMAYRIGGSGDKPNCEALHNLSCLQINNLRCKIVEGKCTASYVKKQINEIVNNLNKSVQLGGLSESAYVLAELYRGKYKDKEICADVDYKTYLFPQHSEEELENYRKKALVIGSKNPNDTPYKEKCQIALSKHYTD